MRLPIDTSQLEFSLVADAEPPRQDERGKHGNGVSVPGDRAGRSAVGAVRWGKDRPAGPAVAGSLGTIAETRERLHAREAELAGVGRQLGKAA